MKYKIGIFFFIGILLMMMPCWAEQPSAKAGLYTIKVDSLARVLEVANYPKNKNFTLVTLSLEAAPALLERVLEIAQDPAATDDTGQPLVFQEIRFPGKERTEASNKVQAQIWFSSPAAGTQALQEFSARLAFYEKRESLRLDFLCVAGEKPAPQMLDNLVVAPEFIGLQNSREGKAYRVSIEVKMPQENPDKSVMWSNEQIELIDAEGHPKTALSTVRTYKYDENGRVAAMVMTATFAPPAQAPRGIRYRTDRLRGVQVLPYHFKNLPLP